MAAELYNFYSISSGILKIFFLIGTGYLLYINGLIKKDTAATLSNVLIWVCVPSLIFTKIVSVFDPVALPRWWLLPLCSLGISFIGLSLGYLFQRGLRNFSSKREFMACCAFQNSGYLPMTMVVFVCSGALCDKILIFIFLFLMGFNISFWSFAPIFLSKNPEKNFKIGTILNPPVIAILISIGWVYLVGRDKIDNVIYDPLLMLGNSSFPLAMMVLGAYLAEYSGLRSESWQTLASCLFVKLIFLPAVVFFIIRYLPLDNAVKFFLLLEASMPIAVSLVIIGEYVKADNKFLSEAIFYSHLLSIVTVPVWLLIFRIE